MLHHKTLSIFFAEDRLFAPESVFTTHTKVTGETSSFFYTNKEMGIPVHDDTFVSAFYVNTFSLKAILF